MEMVRRSLAAWVVQYFFPVPGRMSRALTEASLSPSSYCTPNVPSSLIATTVPVKWRPCVFQKTSTPSPSWISQPSPASASSHWSTSTRSSSSSSARAPKLSSAMFEVVGL
jgi:hypothetical protein